MGMTEAKEKQAQRNIATSAERQAYHNMVVSRQQEMKRVQADLEKEAIFAEKNKVRTREAHSFPGDNKTASTILPKK